MTKFRLKKEARQFFEQKDFIRSILPLSVWVDHHRIPEELLEIVEPVYVSYGHERISPTGVRTANLAGWSGEEKQAHFEFTVWVNDIEAEDYGNIKVAELMDEMQKVLNRYFRL